MTLCSPDPQALRPADEKPNVLKVGLATHFKAALFGAADHNQMLETISADRAAVSLDGKDVPAKLAAKRRSSSRWRNGACC